VLERQVALFKFDDSFRVTILELSNFDLHCGVTGDLLGQPILADLPGVRIYV